MYDDWLFDGAELVFDNLNLIFYQSKHYVHLFTGLKWQFRYSHSLYANGSEDDNDEDDDKLQGLIHHINQQYAFFQIK